jgi:hypothetical protein
MVSWHENYLTAENAEKTSSQSAQRTFVKPYFRGLNLNCGILRKIAEITAVQFCILPDFDHIPSLRI